MKYLMMGLLWLFISPSANAREKVWVAKKPGEKYILEDVTTLNDLPTLDIDASLNQYGGIPVDAQKPTGFFRAEKIKNRWWIIDPEGGRLIQRGIAAVATVQSQRAKDELRRLYTDKLGWASATANLLNENRFNGTGAWSDDKTLEKVQPRLSSTKTLRLMQGFAKQKGVQIGSDNYPPEVQCQFIFDPEFAQYCENECKILLESKNDPWLLGYYTDNEIPWRTNILKQMLKLSPDNHGHKAAQAWLAKKRISPHGISEKSQSAFLEYAADTYFNITSHAIRAADPNHMILGARFNPPACTIPEVLSAAGRYCDIISINYYGAWTPDIKLMDMWVKCSNKPFLITEWYAKGEDSGMANTNGAGWLVRTQKDRALFYQNFTIGLLRHNGCVGWHWFKYADNDPEAESVDQSNIDSNKGIVSSRYQPYQQLLAAMHDINLRVYSLVAYFDKANK